MQDLDPVETQEWLDALESVLDREGEEVTRVSGSKGHIAEGLVNLIAARLA